MREFPKSYLRKEIRGTDEKCHPDYEFCPLDLSFELGLMGSGWQAGWPIWAETGHLENEIVQKTNVDISKKRKRRVQKKKKDGRACVQLCTCTCTQLHLHMYVIGAPALSKHPHPLPQTKWMFEKSEMFENFLDCNFSDSRPREEWVCAGRIPAREKEIRA